MCGAFRSGRSGLIFCKWGAVMFLALWNYLRGYVIISVTGFSVERFVNLAALKGVYIWDIRPEGVGVRMKVGIKGFKALKDCSRKTRCRFRIIEKRGLPFRIQKCKKRTLLSMGALFFIIGLYALSSFIWTIKVEGNERLSTEDILSYCQEIGLAAGSPKFKVNTKDVSAQLIEHFPDISWVGVNLSGTNIKISVVETIPKTEMIDRTTPCDIIAKKDGVIVSIATSAGTPLVSQKDVVEKGDVLVSSEVVIKAGDEEVGREYIHAAAQVKAKTWYEIEDELDLRYIQREYTGETKRDFSVTFFDKNINVVSPDVEESEYEKVNLYDRPFAIGDYIFPLSFKKDEYKKYEDVERTRTEEEARAELEKRIEEKTDELIGQNAEIIDTQVDYIKSGEKITAKAVVTVIERIDEERQSTQEEIDGRNLPNDRENTGN